VTKATPKLRITGAGAMGQGIAQVAVQNGIPVDMLDAATGAADAGRVRVLQRIEHLAAKGQADLAAAT
jgi:3-hydroxybutyryl-CoA dehydrogenase